MLLGGTLSAQETYDLKRCVQHAQQNNLTVKLAQNNLALARLDVEQAERAWYPSVDGRIGGGVQFGRTIDPTTNDFDNQTSFRDDKLVEMMSSKGLITQVCFMFIFDALLSIVFAF